jgi:hypothetical protein
MDRAGGSAARAADEENPEMTMISSGTTTHPTRPSGAGSESLLVGIDLEVE